MAIKTKEGVHPKEKNCSAPTTPRGANNNAKQTDGDSHEHVTLTPSVKPIPNYLRSTISFSNHTNFHCLKKHQHASEAPTVLSSKERTALAKQTIPSESSEKAKKTHARTRSLPNINIRRGEANVSFPTANARPVGSPKAKYLENKQHKLSPLSRQVNGLSKCSEARKSKLKGRKEVEEEKKVEQEIPNESANKVVVKTSKVRALVGKFETVVSLHDPEDDQPVEEEMQVEGDQKPKEEEKEVVKEEIKDDEVGQKDRQEVKEETEGAQLGQHDQKEEEGKGAEMVVVVEKEECKEAKEFTESGEKGTGT
ncbi:uncharacterized protein [Typha latifolia]|uniref:uncharacterized protein n=1 Tax=Typha latifolia TaxID=4733 RepID=UPI003C2D7740